jgi:hypothetical protein
MGVREFKFFHGVTIESEGIQGIIRTLRAQWSHELVDDLNSVHTNDAEAELTRLMSEQIAEEIDNEIMERLREIVNEDENDEILNEITRRINGGQRA